MGKPRSAPKKEEKLIDKLMKNDSLIWAHHKPVQLRDGIKYGLGDYPYQAKFQFFDKRIVNIKKGTQLGLTTMFFLYAIHACKYRKYNQNIIYMMPTVKVVEMMSKVSFDPIIECNPFLQTKETYTASCKQFNGRSINFVGAQPSAVNGTDTKDSSNLRSLPCDLVIRDEIDLMDTDMVELSRQRLNASRFRHEANFGSPTNEDCGIDYLYNISDRRTWQIKCRHCGKYTCLAESFPDSIIQVEGKWIRACVHCHKEIFVVDGDWVIGNPEARTAGYWIDGLLSPMADLEEYMYRYHNTEGAKRAEFMRSILGIAVTEADSQITKEDVYRRCGTSGLQYLSTGQTAMGIDVGDTMHIVVGKKRGKDDYEILLTKACKEFAEIYDIAKKMNVKSLVIDSMPDIHKTKEFVYSLNFPAWRCRYGAENTITSNYDGTQKIVKVNRNEWCDKVRNVFYSDKIVIPRRCRDIDDYAEQLTKMVKSVIPNEKTGVKKPVWTKRGDKNDHYFHATLYFLVACERMGVARSDETQPKVFTKCVSNYKL